MFMGDGNCKVLFGRSKVCFNKDFVVKYDTTAVWLVLGIDLG